MNYVLCGMMGAGKSALGKRIAELSGREWRDVDNIITSKYGDISDLFSEHGEVYFRSLESIEIEKLADLNGLVISTGGGAVLRKKNVELLKKHGKILYLKATKETLVKRLLENQGRPLLDGEGTLEEKVATLLHERESVYEEVADLVLEVDGKSQEENAKLALALFEKMKEE